MFILTERQRFDVIVSISSLKAFPAKYSNNNSNFVNSMYLNVKRNTKLKADRLKWIQVHFMNPTLIEYSV